jgi:transglutaminase-like putative cysteine protease
VAADEADQWKVACALERLVRDTVDAPEQSPAVATAADVAQSHTGDCTEHAVLLAALCRARGIPARVAIGLVYYERSRGFAYHMWTEAWIADRWIPLDGTLGRGGIGAAHLKITHSNLDSSDSLSAFLPVFKLLGQLQLELLSVDGEEPMIAP